MVAESGTPASAATARWVTASAPCAPITRRVARRISSLRRSPFWYIRADKPEQRYQTHADAESPMTRPDAEPARQHHLRGPVPPLGAGQLAAPRELDFSADAEQWQADFTDLERKAAYWNYCLFFWGEDAVADGLSPYIDAAPLEEQKYFLATQQVDEARHAVFFNRFMKEVVGVGGDSVADGLAAIKPELTWGFSKVFDRLVTMSRRAAQGPVDPEAGRRGHALPRDHRGHAGPARPALHHQLPHRPRPAARASATGWRTWPPTSSATSASA